MENFFGARLWRQRLSRVTKPFPTPHPRIRIRLLFVPPSALFIRPPLCPSSNVVHLTRRILLNKYLSSFALQARAHAHGCSLIEKRLFCPAPSQRENMMSCCALWESFTIPVLVSVTRRRRRKEACCRLRSSRFHDQRYRRCPGHRCILIVLTGTDAIAQSRNFARWFTAFFRKRRVFLLPAPLVFPGDKWASVKTARFPEDREM